MLERELFIWKATCVVLSLLIFLLLSFLKRVRRQRNILDPGHPLHTKVADLAARIPVETAESVRQFMEKPTQEKGKFFIINSLKSYAPNSQDQADVAYYLHHNPPSA